MSLLGNTPSGETSRHAASVQDTSACEADSTVQLSAGQMRSLARLRSSARFHQAVPVLVDDADRASVEITAYWARASSQVCGPYGDAALHDGGVRADGVVRFLPDLRTSGRYEVFLHWPSLRSPQHQLATNVPVSIQHAQGVAHRTVNMRSAPRRWTSLGTFPFAPQQTHYVELRNDAVDGHVVADAVLFVPTDRFR